MNETNEIKALLTLLDDPDQEVFETVKQKLLTYGTDIIDNLENYWSTIPDDKTQERIEDLLHQVYFIKVRDQLKLWVADGARQLKEAYLLLCHYRFHHLDLDAVRKELKAIYQSTWLEVNNYLSPVEQLNVLVGIIHSMYKFKFVENKNNDANYYFLNYTLQSKQGNIYSIGALYLILSELLDIPIKAINFPDQFMLAYFDEVYSFLDPKGTPVRRILFYIDPSNGMLYTQNDVDAYLKKIDYLEGKDYQQQLNHKQIIVRHLKALLEAYESQTLINEKEKELLELIAILEAE